jgi:hypothetical protein
MADLVLAYGQAGAGVGRVTAPIMGRATMIIRIMELAGPRIKPVSGVDTSGGVTITFFHTDSVITSRDEIKSQFLSTRSCDLTFYPKRWI